MLLNVRKFLFYNERRSFIQKNVLNLTQLSFLQGLVVIHDIYQTNWYSAFFDIPVLLVIASIWWSIKRHGIYYANLVFFILLPLLGWLVFESIQSDGAAGTVWSFPIIAALFFCFHQYLAWLATVIILAITASACWLYVPKEYIFGIVIAMLMVTFCFSSVFLNVYQQYKDLEYKVHRDPMTGLLNRTLLESTLLDSIEMEETELCPVIFSIDLDNFKYVNDTFGHIEGDKVLVSLANILKKSTPSKDKVFRMGGEEFLIVLNDITLADAQEIAEKIRCNVAASEIIKGHTTTISLGISLYKQTMEWGDWLKQADSALYKAKTTGKNKIVIADDFG